jgi:hypothetical protein
LLILIYWFFGGWGVGVFIRVERVEKGRRNGWDEGNKTN